MNKKIMILGASVLQLPAINKAVEMGLEVIAVDMNPEAVGFNVEGVQKEIISTTDVIAVVECAKKHQIDGIMTLASDMPMRSVAAVVKEMGLVGIDEDTALKATDKAEMREALKSGGVPIPKFFKVANKAEYVDVVKKFDVPFMVKPVDSSGSRGIFKVAEKELADDAYEYSKSFSKSGDVIVEEYMSGPEVSVETLSVDGVCHVIQITDKITTGAPYYVEMGHSQPTQLSDGIVEKIKCVARAANKAIGIKNGPSHTEIIVTSEGPKIVEIGARLGGDCITTHLVPLSTGMDMVKACINIAIGEVPEIEIKYVKGSAIRYFEHSQGMIEYIDGIEKANNVHGVKQISIVHGIGSKLGEINSSTSRVGFVVAQADTVKKAICCCNQAISQIEIRMK